MSSITQVGLRITAQALAHGTFQGSMASMQGGNFLSSFAAGAISSVAASFYGGSGYTNEAGKFVPQTQGLNGILGGGNLGMIAFGSVSGGTGAALTGGNFWQGATTGLVVSGLNHALHGGFAKKYDVTSLHDYEAANGAGHDALAFENKDGTQHYVSKDGTEGGQNGGVYGKSAYTIGDYKSIEAINDDYSLHHQGKRYDITGVYRATRSQINRGITAAEAIAKSNYYLIGNSCTDVLSMGLNAMYNNSFTSSILRLGLKYPIPNVNFFIQPLLYNSHFTNYNLLNK
ncbi:hypothetical protein [Flavobacterium sp. CAU 1735]|uniref:hypothetical protein n=1 Tax=Flavobacterium sp. CAU 1735 TaxID=3140361 RepID=UPI00326147EB